MAVQLKAETDLFLDSLLDPPKNLKRKKKSKKDKDIKKRMPTEVGGKTKKVKKHKKSKDKAKEKKQKRVIVGLQDLSLVSTRFSSNKSVIDWMRNGEGTTAQPCAPGEDPSQNRQCDERISALTQTPRNPTKKKKKVEFNLSPMYLPAKHPRPANCCLTQTPIEDPIMRRESEDGLLTQGSQCRAADDSQSIDEVNSEDLFITQKTFNVPPSETSSSDMSEDASDSAARLTGLTQRPREPYLRLTQSKPTRTTSEAATQTQNFFTELSTYLRFQKLTETSSHQGALRPVDLSLPSRARAKTSPHPLITVARVKGQKVSPAPGSRSSDMTSSEDNDSLLRSKMDLCQMKAVQMRLNESFFFKMKGEDRSPRPQSQLMKLKQSRAKKNRRQ